MPSAVPPPNGITRFTNCRLFRGGALVCEDLWVSSATGKVLRSQPAFFDQQVLPDRTVDLGGRILAPGFIECQLNGAFGFNFSTLTDDALYAKQLRDLGKKLVKTGVTSYLPTVTSQTSELYHKVLPFLAPSRHGHVAEDGAESLGAHVEGPFISPTKNGIHNRDVLRVARDFSDLEAMYGAHNINPAGPDSPAPVKMITAAPELGHMTSLIPELRARGVLCSIGHSEATFEEASAAVAAGATMITHLFNAMRPLHHRNPGIFGVLGSADSTDTHSSPARPFFGVIADGFHLHQTTIKIAWNAHPDGFILVTDAMHLAGLPDGSYHWTNGCDESRIVKKGAALMLEGSDKIAGSSITLIECVNNFLAGSGVTIAQALKTVTSTPAAMLGMQGVKGSLEPGADADLVVLSEVPDAKSGRQVLVVDEAWKYGARVYARE